MKHLRFPPTRLLTTLFTMPLLTLGGCSGGQTGDLSANDPEPTDPNITIEDTGDSALAPACDETTTVVEDPEATTSLGFAPADVLAFADQTFSTSLRWAPSDAQVTYSPSGTTDLTLSISYDAGEIRYITSTFASGGGPEAGIADEGDPASQQGIEQLASAIAAPAPSSDAPDPTSAADDLPAGDVAVDPIGGAGPCRDRLELDVMVTMSTADGGFNETFETTLRTSAANFATFSRAFALDALAGSFSAVAVQPDNGQASLAQPSLSVGLAPFGSYGVFSGFLETTIPGSAQDPDLGSVGIGPLSALASWPSDTRCAADPGNPFSLGLAVTPDDDLGGYTTADVMQLMQSTEPQDVVWQDQAMSTLTLGVQPAGDACVRFDEFSGLNLFLPMTITAVTADERLDAVYETLVSANSNAAQGLGTVAFTVDRFDLGPSDAASTGLTNASLDGFDFGAFTFTLSYAAPTAPPSGFLELRGFTNPVCDTSVVVGPDGSASVAGCPGAEVQTLVSAIIGK